MLPGEKEATSPGNTFYIDKEWGKQIQEISKRSQLISGVHFNLGGKQAHPKSNSPPQLDEILTVIAMKTHSSLTGRQPHSSSPNLKTLNSAFIHQGIDSLNICQARCSPLYTSKQNLKGKTLLSEALSSCVEGRQPHTLAERGEELGRGGCEVRDTGVTPEGTMKSPSQVELH